MAQTLTSIVYPPTGYAWERSSPNEADFDAAALAEAVSYAEAHEAPDSRDIPSTLATDTANAGPDNEIIGPTKARTGINGLILRSGSIVAEWGDTRKVDMTFSVAKSYLATMAGLAYDAGLIRDLDDFVYEYVDDEGFRSEHNRKITWRHLLQQSSEWEGVLWGKPDTADRRRGRDRQLNEPGTFYEYNDVRVNRLALCLLRVWRKPLPQLLNERIMTLIGASTTWEWHGYHNAWVTINGLQMQSVSGGGHWGGGVWASTYDHARFGYLFLRGGEWGGRRIISEEWIQLMTTPSEQEPTYGFMWWLNPEGKLFPSAPETSYFAIGKGTNIIWVDPEHDILAVVRWIDRTHVDGFIQRVLAAIR
jgi:CubicO group peptidase (beta-lactamase class C family)